MKRTLLAALLVLGCLLVAPAYASGDTTITGTLLAHNADSIVVRTVEGERTFAINDVTTMPADLALDSQVTVTYREADGMTIASQVLPAIQPVAATSARAGTRTAASAAVASSSAPVPPPAPAGTGPAEATAPAPLEPAAAPAAEALPATASQLPILALIGIVMLTASLLLRWAR